VPLAAVITIIVFTLIHLLPGDPAEVMLGFETKDPDVIASVRTKLGLDKPLTYQYVNWLASLLHGDFGTSTRTGRPVLETVVRSLPYTLELALYALLLTLSIAIPLGTIAGARSSKIFNSAFHLVTLLGLSLPHFWIGAMFILLFCTHLEWFPVMQYPPLLASPIRNIWGFFLPALTLSISHAAAVARMVRSSVLEIRNEDYVKTARAKGLSERIVTWRHILRNAMIPIITIVGVRIGYLIGGAVVVEQVFAIPGIARLSVQAITQRDYPTLLAVVLFIVFGFALINLLVDVLYIYLNPKIRYG